MGSQVTQQLLVVYAECLNFAVMICQPGQAWLHQLFWVLKGRPFRLSHDRWVRPLGALRRLLRRQFPLGVFVVQCLGTYPSPRLMFSRMRCLLAGVL